MNEHTPTADRIKDIADIWVVSLSKNTAKVSLDVIYEIDGFATREHGRERGYSLAAFDKQEQSLTVQIDVSFKMGDADSFRYFNLRILELEELSIFLDD